MGDPIAYRIIQGSTLDKILVAEYYSVSGVLVHLGMRIGAESDLGELFVYMPDGRQLDGVQFLQQFAPEFLDVNPDD